jgi:hypothetical protein
VTPSGASAAPVATAGGWGDVNAASQNAGGRWEPGPPKFQQWSPDQGGDQQMAAATSAYAREQRASALTTSSGW